MSRSVGKLLIAILIMLITRPGRSCLEQIWKRTNHPNVMNPQEHFLINPLTHGESNYVALMGVASNFKILQNWYFATPLTYENCYSSLDTEATGLFKAICPLRIEKAISHEPNVGLTSNKAVDLTMSRAMFQMKEGCKAPCCKRSFWTHILISKNIEITKFCCALTYKNCCSSLNFGDTRVLYWI